MFINFILIVFLSIPSYFKLSHKLHIPSDIYSSNYWAFPSDLPLPKLSYAIYLYLISSVIYSALIYLFSFISSTFLGIHFTKSLSTTMLLFIYFKNDFKSTLSFLSYAFSWKILYSSHLLNIFIFYTNIFKRCTFLKL